MPTHEQRINQSDAIVGDAVVVFGGGDGVGALSYSKALSAAVSAQNAGDLDSTFGVNGIVVLDVFNQDNYGYAMVVQPNGKIVLGGDYLIRFNSDGSLDSSFGIGGIASTDRTYSIVLQPDGKIVTANESGLYFQVNRYHVNGALDTTFSADGKQTIDFSVDRDQARSVTLQADGKIVAAGYADNSPASRTDFALARLNPDGSLDSSFSNDGKLSFDFYNNAGSDEAYSVLVQPDGKIVAAGYAFTGSNDDFALVRLNTDGTFDNSFSFDGKVTAAMTSVPSTVDIAYSMLLQPDGKIVAAGRSSYDYAVARYNSDGTLDNTFSGDGKTTTHILGSISNEARAVALQPDGKILAAGISDIYNSSTRLDFSIVRYNTDGSLDNSFNLDGAATTAVSAWNDHAYAMAVQPDGKIVVAGWENDNSSNSNLALVRYHSGLNIVLLNIDGVVATETGIPISGVSVVLSGDDSQTDITDTTGRYTFSVAEGGTYTITPSKTNDVVVNNGITSIDVLLMRRHLLGTGALGSPYKIIAAAECNADGDTLVSTNDILLTRSLILGNINAFPTNRLWQFVSSDYVFPDNNHPFPFPKTRTYANITTNQTNQDFIGIKLGDVNGSWDANTP